jgi:hypothetical protein
MATDTRYAAVLYSPDQPGYRDVLGYAVISALEGGPGGAAATRQRRRPPRIPTVPQLPNAPLAPEQRRMSDPAGTGTTTWPDRDPEGRRSASR